jgi:hypothetical protein
LQAWVHIAELLRQFQQPYQPEENLDPKSVFDELVALVHCG